MTSGAPTPHGARPRLVLASTSPARRALLATLGCQFEVEPPGVDEDVEAGTSVVDTVRTLALRKARAVAVRHPGAVVVGSDQLAELDGEALGKARDRADAHRRLARLAGREHALHTALAVVTGSGESLAVDTVTLTMRPLDDAALERYLDTGEWEGCAGCYRIEGLGVWLFDRILGDRTSIQGLPLSPLVRMLRAHGQDPLTPPG